MKASMFWIFKFTPDFFWYLLPLLGLVSLGLARVGLLYAYKNMLNIGGTTVLALGLFAAGMLYADNAWKQAARELQAKVEVAEAKSQVVNEVVKEKLVTQTRIVRQRGEETVRYIDREVVKIDERCTIPPEFVNAHNKAATR